MRYTGIYWSVIPLLLSLGFTGCNKYQHPLTFTENVKPILQRSCISCHQPGGIGYERSKLDLRTYDGVMAGTKYGRVVIPGDSFNSVLIQLVEHRADPSISMPYHKVAIPEDEIRTLKAWIEQGARP